MFPGLRLLAVLPLLTPGPGLAEVTVPGTVSLCADLAMEITATPKGRDQITVTLRVRNTGPGDYPGTRGAQSVDHVVTVKGQEVERKKHAFTAIPAGGVREFTFTRTRSAGDFGVWAAIQFAPAAGKPVPDCNSQNNAAVKPVTF